MSREEAIERTRVQLVKLIESDQVDATQRINAAGILLKSQRTGDEPTKLNGALKGVLRALSDA